MIAGGESGKPSAASWHVILAIFSVVLLMIDPTRHLFADHEQENGTTFAMYTMVDGTLALSPVGKMCRTTTILGFLLLSFALCGFFGIFQKLFDRVQAGKRQAGASTSP